MKIRNSGMTMLLLIGALLWVALANVAAATTVSSTFASGTDGWTGLGAIVSWRQTDGNPQPSLNEFDNDHGWAQVIAPAKFHGQWLSTGTVAADLRFVGSGSPVIYDPMFAITDGNTAYEYDFTTLPTTSWRTYSAALNSAGWKRITNSTPNWYNWNVPIGTESLATVLLHVTDFHIRVDLTSDAGSGDTSNLDNIKSDLSSVPLPSTVILLGTGVVGLMAIRRRKFTRS